MRPSRAVCRPRRCRAIRRNRTAFIPLSVSEGAIRGRLFNPRSVIEFPERKRLQRRRTALALSSSREARFERDPASRGLRDGGASQTAACGLCRPFAQLFEKPLDQVLPLNHEVPEIVLLGPRHLSPQRRQVVG